MPGRHLSGVEESLAKRWAADSDDAYPKPTLRGIVIDGEPGLRGIRHLDVAFDYPITAICGRNGSGKTTLLALAALAFHGKKGKKAKVRQQRSAPSLYPPYYTFKDFFFKGPTDPDVSGVKVTWRYRGAATLDNELSITKGSTKWMHYERRPTRPVVYVGERRILPAIEHSVLRQHFGSSIRPRLRRPLSPEYCEKLSRVMGRPYRSAETVHSDRYSVRSCEAQAAYSSFNMGAGEDVLIELFVALQDCPPGSLVVVEEIELGLHPAALIALSDELKVVAKEKSLQIIISTHSPDFLDSLPAQARVLVRTDGGRHEVVRAPTTRLAMGDLRGQIAPELLVLCEDETARVTIEEALTHEVRRRITVIEVGSRSELTKHAAHHLRLESPHALLLIWDGDVTDESVGGQLRELNGFAADRSRRISWAFLPGQSPPEKWVLSQLDCEEALSLLAGELRAEDPTCCGGLVSSLQTCGAHAIAHEMALQTGLPPDQCRRALVRAVARRSDKPLAYLLEVVKGLLDGEPVEGRRA